MCLLKTKIPPVNKIFYSFVYLFVFKYIHQNRRYLCKRSRHQLRFSRHVYMCTYISIYKKIRAGRNALNLTVFLMNGLRWIAGIGRLWNAFMLKRFTPRSVYFIFIFKLVLWCMHSAKGCIYYFLRANFLEGSDSIYFTGKGWKPHIQ